MSFCAAVVTVSDKGWRAERKDESGYVLERLLYDAGARSVARVLVPDERRIIADTLRKFCLKKEVALVITTGGTGMAPRDVTPEATSDVIERPAPGIAEAIRAGSMKITPQAMLSRAVSGICGRTLIINFPGSPKACEECFAIIKPALSHALELLSGAGGECGKSRQ